MSESALDIPLQELEVDFERLLRLLQLLEQVREFGALESSSNAEGGDFADSARRLRDSVSSSSPDLAVLSGTLLLYAAGRFEHFARQLCEALCDTFATRAARYTDLPPAMQLHLITKTVEVLASPGRFGFDEIEARALIVTLARNLEADGDLGSVNSAAMSVTTTNMTQQALSELFKRLGLASLWSDVSKQAALKTHFATDKDSEASRLAHETLDEIMRTRNLIAHPTGSPEFPDVAKVATHVRYLRVLARTVTDVIKMHAASMKPTR